MAPRKDLPNRQTLIEQRPARRPAVQPPPDKGKPPDRQRQEVIEERPRRER
jgi:hypothetical protein